MKPDLAYSPVLRFIGILCLFLNAPLALYGQHQNKITATLDQETKIIEIQQEFTYFNDSEDTLEELFLTIGRTLIPIKPRPWPSGFLMNSGNPFI